jgi:Coenzyme PQQ synthesis protein D (PqqD)
MKNCYIARSRSVAARQLGEEMVIMSAQDSTLFNLNPVATLIWLAADGHTPLETIVQERVCSTFEVELEEALQDAQLFVSELTAHGVLLLGETPITDSSAETAKRP